jgi:lipopolysaccharide export system ATP-binding protein
MKTRQELLDYLVRLEAHDVSVAVALQELLRRADEEGRADRGVWVASVREAFDELRSRADGGRLTARFGEEEALSQYLREQVLARLEEAGIAYPGGRKGEGEEGWDRLVVDPDLWGAIMTGREAFLEEVDETLQHLQNRGGTLEREVGHGPAEAPEGSRLHAEGLTKIYRKRKVVDDVAISVRQGEIVGLLGPNGAGKTTTFYMIVGLIPPNEGRVYLDDRELTEVPMYQRARLGVGYLAQEPSVFRKLSVEDNVMAILETLDLSRKERRARLEELLDELSIAHLRDNKAYSLSGGERRRLEITRALVQRPKFMLLDEPFAGIDPIAVNDIQQIVHGLKHREIGAIISDHNVEQTLEIVDRAYIMYEGRIRVSGTVSELVWNDEVAEIYFGPTLTEKMRGRYRRPVTHV